MHRHLPKLIARSVQGLSHFKELRTRIPDALTPCLASSKWMSTSSLIGPDNVIRSNLPDIHIPTNVPFHQFLFDQCDQYKTMVAVEDYSSGEIYTFDQVKANSIRVASALHRLGYRKGDVVSAYCTNNIHLSVLILACSATGVWFSAVNPACTADELIRQSGNSGSKAVFASPQGAPNVLKALTLQANQVKDLFVFGEAEGFRPFQTLLDDDGKMFPDVDINPLEDVLLLPYSSGTTGLPKGVMLTHYNCLANCMQITSSVKTTPSDRSLGLLPLFHVYGMIVVQFSILVGGSSVVYLQKFEPQTFLGCLQDKKISLAYLVPPIILFLAKHPVVSQFNLTALKRTMCGAAPLGAEVTAQFLSRFAHGVTLNQGYGLTEMPVATADTTSTTGSVGHLLANTVGKIVDSENTTLAAGEFGELCLKGPQIMKGYFKNDLATSGTIDKDGWLHTGDVGYVSKDGLFNIQDRLKELIKYKGFQVPPAELEALLLGNPHVQDVAVLGVPDEQCGELPKAFVVRKPGSRVTEEEVIKYVEDRVSSLKRLRGGVQFVDEIPKSPSGKILRRIIKENYI